MTAEVNPPSQLMVFDGVPKSQSAHSTISIAIHFGVDGKRWNRDCHSSDSAGR